MAEYIKRSDALEALETMESIEDGLTAMHDIPAADVVEVNHGRWIDRYGGKHANPLYECSECKEKALYKIEVNELGKEQLVQALSAICPNCGAKMVGGGQDE